MSFNMNKYDNVRFHSDELTHKRIKALLLWFEYEVYKRNAFPESQLKLMDRWINTLVKQEYYEVVPFFRNMKIDMEVKFSIPEADNVTEKVEIIKKVSFLTILGNKIRNIFVSKKK